ncbi:hypothetical protein FVE85_2307 [Porphyridium purpureum]|uniref:RWP-RK domain-containing protein n=1 Tax=Porphyridium purpureum TaxID=35688 RepID=A0A5J4YZ87_PORPP|nr:hypothetical protein FVE85_2307 [Porphyridium purpureum]|eukprot:POR0135..scf209_3
MNGTQLAAVHVGNTSVRARPLEPRDHERHVQQRTLPRLSGLRRGVCLEEDPDGGIDDLLDIGLLGQHDVGTAILHDFSIEPNVNSSQSFLQDLCPSNHRMAESSASSSQKNVRRDPWSSQSFEMAIDSLSDAMQSSLKMCDGVWTRTNIWCDPPLEPTAAAPVPLQIQRSSMPGATATAGANIESASPNVMTLKLMVQSPCADIASGLRLMLWTSVGILWASPGLGNACLEVKVDVSRLDGPIEVFALCGSAMLEHLNTAILVAVTAQGEILRYQHTRPSPTLQEDAYSLLRTDAKFFETPSVVPALCNPVDASPVAAVPEPAALPPVSSAQEAKVSFKRARAPRAPRPPPAPHRTASAPDRIADPSTLKNAELHSGSSSPLGPPHSLPVPVLALDKRTDFRSKRRGEWRTVAEVNDFCAAEGDLTGMLWLDHEHDNHHDASQFKQERLPSLGHGWSSPARPRASPSGECSETTTSSLATSVRTGGLFGTPKDQAGCGGLHKSSKSRLQSPYEFGESESFFSAPDLRSAPSREALVGSAILSEPSTSVASGCTYVTDAWLERKGRMTLALLRYRLQATHKSKYIKVITKDDLRGLLMFSRELIAEELNISVTLVKKFFRACDIDTWPYRRVYVIRRRLRECEQQLAGPDGARMALEMALLTEEYNQIERETLPSQ